MFHLIFVLLALYTLISSIPTLLCFSIEAFLIPFFLIPYGFYVATVKLPPKSRFLKDIEFLDQLKSIRLFIPLWKIISIKIKPLEVVKLYQAYGINDSSTIDFIYRHPVLSYITHRVFKKLIPLRSYFKSDEAFLDYLYDNVSIDFPCDDFSYDIRDLLISLTKHHLNKKNNVNFK